MNSIDYGMALTMKMKRKIKLLIVDDDRGLASTTRELISLVAKDITVVGIANNSKECLQIESDQSPDVILLDANLGNGDTGIDTILKLNEIGSQSKIIMYTMFPDDINFFTSFNLGVRGFLGKGTLEAANYNNLINAIRMVASGRQYFTDSDLIRIQKEFGQIEREYFSERILDSIESPKEKRITERECEVILAMIKLRDRQLAADSLGISPGTVKNHISSINEKLGTTNIEQAAIVASKLGIIHLY